MVDEIPDSRFMMLKFLRKRKCFADKPGNTLEKYVIKAFNIAGFPCFFADSFVTLGWQNASISPTCLPSYGLQRPITSLSLVKLSISPGLETFRQPGFVARTILRQLF